MTTDIATIGIALDSRDVKEGTKQLTELEKVSAKVTTTVKSLVGVWAGWKVVKNVIVESAQLNARFETMGVVMDRVGRNAGYSATQMREWELSLRKTGIAMIEARTTMTRMAQAQLDLSKTSELARIAQDAAVIGGINSSEAFERMIHGIQSSQTEILRTIGINVNFQQSYENLARELKINAAQLTETQKAQARMNSVLEYGSRIAGVYEESMGTAGKQMQSMKRYVDDLKVKFGEVFNHTLTDIVFGLSGHLKNANTELDEMSSNGQIEEWARSVQLLFTGMAEALNSTVTAAKALGTFAGHRAALSDIRSRYDAELSAAPRDASFQSAAQRAEITRRRDAALMAENLRYQREMSPVRDQFGAVWRAAEENQKKRDKQRTDDLTKEKRYLADIAQVQKAYANYSVEIQQQAQQELAKFYFPKEPVGYVPPSATPSGRTGSSKSDEAKNFVEGLKREVETFGMGETALKRYEAAKLKLTGTNRRLVDSYIKQLELQREQQRQAEENNALFDETLAKQDEQHAKISDAIAELRLWNDEQKFEASLMKMSNAERETAIRLRRLEASGIDTQSQAYRDFAAQVRGNVDMQQFTRLTGNTQFAKLKADQEDMVFLARAFTEGIRDANGELHKLSEAEYLDAVTSRLGIVNDKLKETNKVAEELGYAFQSAFEEAVIGGGKFSDVLRGLAQDIQKIILRKTVTEPLGNAIGGLFSGFNWSSLWPFADGGIMTAHGAMPLRAYASGGIANTPQVAMYGEGSQPEAYVPLPDGRTIPVTLKGESGGSINTSIVVNVSSDGSTSTTRNDATQLSKQIENAVVGVIIREKRPGGILNGATA